MIGRRIAAGLLALLLGLGAGACGNDDVDSGDQGPGRSSEEDPTLGDPEGGGTSDADGEGDTDEGDPASGNTDSGSGTGSGRGDG